MFTTEPAAALELCRALGKEDHLVETVPTPDRAFVAGPSGMHPVPKGLSLMLPSDLESIVASPLLDDLATKRFLAERDVPPRDWSRDESLESFAIRRFGKAAFEQLIQPLVGGIYTADPKKLSMHSTMARFVEMEQQHGSLIAAAENVNRSRHDRINERESSGARYSLFRAPRNGMGELVKWIETALASAANVEIQTDCCANSIEKTSRGWQIETNANGASKQRLVDSVVLATSAKQTSKLLNGVDSLLTQELSTISAASSAIVVLGLHKSDLAASNFAGYGVIVPSVLNRKVIATSFSSNKFEGRAPADRVLVRCFMGGATQRELVDLDDQSLIKIALDELSLTVGFARESQLTPEIVRVFRWHDCMPQYHLGHLDRVDEIEALVARHSQLELAGNSYRGVGVPACIKSGVDAIDRLLKKLPR